MHTEPTSDTPFTLGGVVLSEGKPWVVGPGHAITGEVFPTGNTSCPQPSCGLGTITLNSCPHYPSSPLALWQQSPASNPQTVAYMSKWPSVFPPFQDSQGNLVYSDVADVAAGFIDNDTVDGNGSLSVDRKLTGLPIGAVTKFSGISIDPMVQDYIYIVSAIDSASYPGCDVATANHVNPGQISQVDFTELSAIECSNAVLPLGVNRLHQIEYVTNFNVLNGVSGSLVLNQTSGAVVAVQNLGLVQCQNQSCSEFCPVNVGQGTVAWYAKSFLGFDAWYGEDTINDNTIGVFRRSTATWYVDNGNGKLESCGQPAPTTSFDQCFVYGATTDVPLTGNWDDATQNAPPGTWVNDVTVGYYRPNVNPTFFSLSNTNPPSTPLVTVYAGPPSFGYKPVTGKWQGTTAATKVGVFRPGSGGWYLDNGNQVVEACGTDYCFFLAACLYQPGDIPIAGDWDNNGVVSVGIFRP